jgi:hypothetical protein
VVVDGGTTTVTAGEHAGGMGGRLSATGAPCGDLSGVRQAAFRCLSGSRRTLSA